MSEESLRRFLERLNGDAVFRERARNDAAAAFAEFELSSSEQESVISNDEDALRRLAGVDVSGYMLNLGGLGIGHVGRVGLAGSDDTLCSSVCITCMNPGVGGRAIR